MDQITIVETTTIKRTYTIDADKFEYAPFAKDSIVNADRGLLEDVRENRDYDLTISVNGEQVNLEELCQE